VDILDGDIYLLGELVVFHDFGASAEGNLSGCIDERTGVDDEVVWSRGDYAFGVCGVEDCGQELLVLN